MARSFVSADASSRDHFAVAAELAGQGAERAAHVAIRGLGGEHAQAGLPRRGRIVEIGVVEAHPRAVGLDALGGVGRRVVADDLERARLIGDELGRLEMKEQPARRADTLARLEARTGLAEVARDRRHRGCAHAAADGGHVEGIAEPRERLARPLERLVLDAAEAHQQVEARLTVGRLLQLLREHVDERLPVAARLLDAGEAGAQRAQVARQRRQRVVVGGRRAVEIDELLLLQRRDVDEQRRLRGRVGLARGAPPVRRQQLRPVRELHREILELALRLAVVRVELERLAVVAARALEVREPLARDARELAEQAQLGRPARLAERALEARGDLAPLVGLAREAQHLAVERLAVGIDVERAHRPLERERARAEALLAQLADLRDLREARGGVGGGRELDLDHRDQARPLLLLAVDRRERRGGADVRRIDREHALPHLARALERLRLVLRRDRSLRGARDDLVGALLRELGRALDERQPRRLRVDAIGDAEQRLDELVGLTELGVQLLEAREVAGVRVQIAQRAQRLGVRRLEIEDLLPGLRGELRRLRAIGVDRAELLEQRDRVLALAGRRHDRDLTMQDLGERASVALLALVQRGERGERLRDRREIGRLRLAEDRVVDLDREPGIAEALGRQPRHLRLLGPAIRRRHHARLAGEHVDQRAPLLAARVDVLEARDRVGIGRRELEDALERLDRVREVAEPLGPQVRDLAQQHDALAVGQVRRLGLARQQRDHVVPPAERAVLAGQLVGGAPVVRIDLEDRVVGVEHHHVEPQLVAIDLDDVEHAGDAARDVGLGQPIDLVLHQVEQRVPLLGAAVEPRERAARVLRGRIATEMLLPRFDRLLGVLLRLRQLGDLDGERPRAVRLGRVGRRCTGDLLEHREQLPALAFGRVVLAIEVERGRVRGLDLAHAPEVLLGLVEILEVLPQHHRDLKEHADVVAGVLARLHRGLVRRHHARPVARARRGVGDEAQRLRLRGIEREHLAHRRGRAREVGEPVAGDVRQPEQRTHPVVGRRGQLRAILEVLREVGPALRPPQQTREVERGLAVLVVDVERPAQVLLGLGCVGREPHVGLGGRHEQPGREVAIGRRRRLVHVLRGELLPVLRGEIEVRDRLLRHRVGRLDTDDLVERGARARGIEELAVEDHPLLEQEVHLALDVAGRRHLDVEELDHRIGAAAVCEHLARGREPRRAHVGRCGPRGGGERIVRLRVVGVVLEDSEERRQIGHRGLRMLVTSACGHNAERQFVSRSYALASSR